MRLAPLPSLLGRIKVAKRVIVRIEKRLYCKRTGQLRENAAHEHFLAVVHLQTLQSQLEKMQLTIAETVV